MLHIDTIFLKIICHTQLPYRSQNNKIGWLIVMENLLVFTEHLGIVFPRLTWPKFDGSPKNSKFATLISERFCCQIQVPALY